MRDLLDESIRAALANETGKVVSLGKVPAPLPELPYAVLYAIHGSEGYGAWSDPEECRDFLYQVRSVGRSHRQCAWMSKKIEGAFVGRGSSGEFSTSFNIPEVTVSWRRTVELGSILPTGEELWQVDDTYKLRAERLTT